MVYQTVRLPTPNIRHDKEIYLTQLGLLKLHLSSPVHLLVSPAGYHELCSPKKKVGTHSVPCRYSIRVRSVQLVSDPGNNQLHHKQVTKWHHNLQLFVVPDQGLTLFRKEARRTPWNSTSYDPSLRHTHIKERGLFRWFNRNSCQETHVPYLGADGLWRLSLSYQG